MFDVNEINEQFWALVEQHIPDGPWNPSSVAEQAVADIRATAPSLLKKWLDQNATRFVHEELNRRNLSERSRRAKRVKVQRFAAAAAKAETGDTTALTEIAEEFWASTWNIVTEDGEHVNKPLFQLDGGDCDFLADEYRKTEKHSKMHAAFFRQVSAKVGAKTVEEVFEPEQIAKLYESITRAA